MTMEYVGNLKDLGDASWVETVLDEVLSKTGILRPKQGGKPEGYEGDAEWQRAIDAGYSPDAVYFQMFNQSNLTTEIPKFHTCGRSRHWWITKMMPADFMPMHSDPHTKQEKNVDRFWIPLQDWEQGHIFMYENDAIVNYKAGDVYRYTSAQAVHGAANIGLKPRVVLQVTLYEE
jgi:hypothetical protein